MSNNKIKNVTIGSDPEMFIFDPNTDKYISAVGMIGGSKASPLPITNDGHFIQEDNVAVEFNIPPCTTSKELVKHILFVKNYISETILSQKGLALQCVASALFDKDQLNTDEAKTFGCDPDFNAWTGNLNEINRIGVDPKLRVCGGHIHVGYDNPNRLTSVELVKAMDLFLAVPAVLIDSDIRRRQLYGKAGSYRYKKFGVEHRTLSNFWIQNELLIEWVFQNVHQAVEFVNIDGIITNEEQIIECINTGDKDLAEEIVEDYSIPMPSTVVSTILEGEATNGIN